MRARSRSFDTQPRGPLSGDGRHSRDAAGPRADEAGRRTAGAGAGVPPLLLGLGLFLVYVANGRDPGTFDTAATTMLPLTLIRGEGVYLDRFAPMLVNPRDGRSSPLRHAVASASPVALPRRPGIPGGAADRTPGHAHGPGGAGLGSAGSQADVQRVQADGQAGASRS